jgi:DNA-binding IscR family transcriptional regulator
MYNFFMNSRFALSMHILTILASSDGLLTSERLSEMVGVNAVVVRRLAQMLIKADMVQSRLGPGGGLKLSLEPAKITLACVFTVTKDETLLKNIALNRCTCIFSSALEETIAGASEAAEMAFLESLRLTTLQDVLDKAMSLLPIRVADLQTVV